MMNFTRLVQEINSEEKGAEFLRSKGILHSHRKCEEGHAMSLTDGDLWRCRRMDCLSQVEVREGTWLEGTELPWDRIVYFIYCWSQDYTDTKFCRKELGLSLASLSGWNNLIRDVCADSLLKAPMMVGGPGETVEVLLCPRMNNKRNNNSEETSTKEWFLGGISRESKACFLVSIPGCSKETVEVAISKSVLLESTVVFKSMEDVQEARYKHLSGDHFADESFVVSSLTRAKEERVLLESNLPEFLWKLRHQGKDLFQQILGDIRAFCPLDDGLEKNLKQNLLKLNPILELHEMKQEGSEESIDYNIKEEESNETCQYNIKTEPFDYLFSEDPQLKVLNDVSNFTINHVHSPKTADPRTGSKNYFKSRRQYKKRKRNGPSMKFPHKCLVCDKSYRKHSTLNFHNEIVHGLEPEMKTMDHQTLTEMVLTSLAHGIIEDRNIKHNNCRKPVLQHICKVCNKVYKSKQAFTLHLQGFLHLTNLQKSRDTFI